MTAELELDPNSVLHRVRHTVAHAADLVRDIRDGGFWALRHAAQSLLAWVLEEHEGWWRHCEDTELEEGGVASEIVQHYETFFDGLAKLVVGVKMVAPVGQPGVASLESLQLRTTLDVLLEYEFDDVQRVVSMTTPCGTRHDARALQTAFATPLATDTLLGLTEAERALAAEFHAAVRRLYAAKDV